MPQGLDRLVEVNIEAPGTRNQYGEHVPGAVQTFRRWTTRMAKTKEDVEQEGGTYNLVRRTYRVRWFRELANAAPSQVTLVDGPLEFNVEKIVEPEGSRRRFLDLEGVAVAEEA